MNLKLCSACEAINTNNAERCHSCNAEFRIEPQVVTFEMDAPPPADPVEAAARAGKAVPAVWRLAKEHARKRSNKSAAVLTVLPLLAAGAAYYFYAASQAIQAPPVAPIVEAARKSEPTLDPEGAPKEPARPQSADVKPAQAPVASGKIAAPRTAAAPARSTPASEPKRTTTAVTHTRTADAATSSRTAAASAPAKTTVTTLPVSATLPVSVTSAAAASARILPVSESPPAIAETRRTSSVTHTKADLTESAVTTAAPAAATVPAEGRNDEPAGCPPAVVALGLCKSR